MATQPFDFQRALADAVRLARQDLGQSFQHTDKRANAYYRIATVLRTEAQRLNGSALGDQYRRAALQLEEQAEITTYSGLNGRAALVGNYAAMINNLTRYNVPLDVFSWQIDNAVVRFFEIVSQTGRYGEISEGAINAVDGLVWASKGMLGSFPGTALNIDYSEIPADSLIWRVANVPAIYLEQIRKDYGPLGYVNPLGSNGGLGVATTFLHPLAHDLGGQPSFFGFSDDLEDQYHGVPIRNSDGSLYYYEDEFGRKIISRADRHEDGSYSFNRDGRFVWVENEAQLGGRTGQILGALESAALNGMPVYLLGFVEIIPLPDGGSTYLLKEVDGKDPIDAFKDRLGANFGPDGLRVRNNEDSQYYDPNKTNISERDFLQLWFDTRREHLSSIPLVSIREPDGSTVTGRAVQITASDGTVSFFMQEASVASDGSLTFGPVKKMNSGAAGVELENVSAETAQAVEEAAALEEERRARELAVLDAIEPEMLARASDAVEEPLEGNWVTVTLAERFGVDYDENGNLIVFRTAEQAGYDFSQIDPETGNLLPRGFVAARNADGWKIVDKKFRQSFVSYDEDGNVAQTIVLDGIYESNGTTKAGASVVQSYENGHPTDTNIRINGNPVGIEFSDIGAALGSQLGYRIAGDNRILSIGLSAVLSTLGDNLGDALDGVIGRQSVHNALDDAFDTFGPELLSNLRSAGIGALSSFLTAELIDVLGLEGTAGEILNSGAGAVIGQILTNVAAGNAIFSGINPTMIGSAIGSYLGTQLAMEVKTFETIGGQIGAAVGSSAFVAGGTYLMIAQLGFVPGLLPVAALAFVGFLVGGLIGSLFGGTPRSGADALWDTGEGRFVVANSYARKGGSKDAAENAANTVAETLNGLLETSGGTLLNPDAVQSGNYGMRKSDFVYRPISTQDKDAITQRFSGKDGLQNLIGHGVFQAITDPDFQIAGGSNYIKRAIYGTFDLFSHNPAKFDTTVLLGNIASAQAYEGYLANSALVNAVVAAEPDSAFAIETAITFARAVELGLTKRHRSDWFGGFSQLLKEAGGHASSVQFGFDYDPSTQQVSRLIGVGRFVLGDSIDVGAQSYIEGTAGDDALSFTHSSLTIAGDGSEYQIAGGSDRLGFVHGLKLNGEDVIGPIAVDVAATIDTGAGNDTVHAGDLGNNVFGADGNDTLYGGRLDDWLLGGDGDDRLDAGSATAGTLGGDGNYLNGGAGNDQLFGREGSDWLEGGEGTDVLRAGAGGDILSGGAGDGDELYGGSGDDSYILRRGDGADLAEDQDLAAPPAPATGDAVAARFAGIRGGLIQRDWLGRSPAVVAAQSAGGEDVIAFGHGISINDVRLTRAANGRDLLIQLTAIDPATQLEVLTGDSLLIKDWFADPFKRVEWLKFVDGTEVRIGDVTSFIVGTAGNDVLIGTDGNDFVYGGSGNDKLYLLAGNDIGLGGTGDDLVSGGSGKDMVVGGLGDDQLIGGSGDDALTGDGGHDKLYGSQGHDILSGGRGNDVIAGGAGNDRFKFSRGDGHDTVFDDYSDHWTAVWQAGNWLNGYVYHPETSEVTAPDGSYVRKNFGTVGEPDLRWVGQFDYDDTTGELRHFNPPAGAATTVSDKGEDTIEFALDINVQDVMFERVAGTDDLRVVVSRANAEGSLAGAADSITLRDWYDNPGSIETFAFYQAGEIDVSATGYSLIGGTDGQEGADGNPLRGTAGKDWITGVGGDDHLAGGEGDDIVSGGAGSDHLKGEAGNDVLYGGSGNDVLDGGLGADILSGGAGLDSASYASADNAVTVYLTNSALNQGDAKGDVYDSIENLIGSGAGDVLGGDEGDNELTGGKGNDSLLGGLGNDTYRWNIGDGADTIEDIAFVAETIISASGDLAAGYSMTWQQQGTSKKYDLKLTSTSGEVVYSAVVNIGSGSSAQPHPRLWPKQGWKMGFEPASDGSVSRVVHDTAVDAGEADAIEFGAGISLADLGFERIGNDLKIAHVHVEDNNNGDGFALGQSNGANLLVRNHFLANNRIEHLVFADGLAVSLASVLAADSSGQLTGTAADDLITGQRGVRDDVLDGGLGNDAISGGEGNDTLLGGDGDDVLEGGKGADILDGGAHTPEPVVGEQAAALLRGDTVRYATSSAGVTVDLALTTAQSGGDAAGDILSNIENVTGSQHDDALSGDDGANRLDALGGNNVLVGRGGDDVLVSGDGADQLDGGDGEDNLSSGGGNDVLRGGAGKDLLAAGDGDDHLFGDDGDDTLSAGDGSDHLEGGAGADQLLGGAGNDTLLGGLGADMLAGDGGNDTLQGGADADRYFLAAGFGHDTLTDSEGANEILIDQSISYDTLWFHRSGSDLVMTVRGSDDRLTISGFFAAEHAASIYSLQTATHRLFLGHPDVRNFLDAMQATGPGGAPAQIPETVAALMPRYWHPGTTATPWAEDFQLEIAEDTTTGQVAIGAIDHDENIDEYRITVEPLYGTAAVDPLGRFTYAPGLNFNGADSFKVAVIDEDGQAREIEVRVGVTPVDDAPVIDGPAGGPLTIDEYALLSETATGSDIGTILAREFDGEAIVFTLTDDAEQRFAISAEGVITVADAARLNHEAAAEHTITVLVTDAVGSTDQRTFTIAIRDVNEENTLPAAYGWFIDENSAVGTVIDRVRAEDPDGEGTAFVEQRYAFVHADNSLHQLSEGGRYAIDALTGDVSVAAHGNFEAAEPTRTYLVEARDNRGQPGFTSSRTQVTIAINDLNEANAFAGDVAFTLAENEGPGKLVGTVSAGDEDTPGTTFATQRYFFWDGAQASETSTDERFAIDELTGAITATASYDYESDVREASYVVVARDNDGTAPFFTAFQNIAISLTNVNETPEMPVLETALAFIIEGAAADTVVARFELADPDETVPLLVASGNPGGLFSIVGGELRLAATVDFETLALLGFMIADEDQDERNDIRISILLHADDGDLQSAQTAPLVFYIEDVNEAPSAIVDAGLAASFAERDRIAAGTARPALTLAALSVADPDRPGQDNATYTYTVDDARFDMVGNELRLRANIAFDHEAESQVTVRVTATDESVDPLSISRDFTFAVEDCDDILEGTPNADVLVGQANRDIITGFSGNDRLEGLTGNDDLYGSDGADTLLGGEGDDRLEGGSDDDVLFGEAGDDTLFGGSGHDRLSGGEGADTIDGGEGDDLIVADTDSALDTIQGGAGTDRVTFAHFGAGVAADLSANTANGDTVSGVEEIEGSAYADTLAGDANGNRLIGGGGDDALSGLAGSDRLEGGDGADALDGGEGDDVLFGDAGDDVLAGGAGSDDLYGGDGADDLSGGAGDDRLEGGRGNDVMNAGDGNDTYIIDRRSDHDVIFNYDGTGDDIDVLGFSSAHGEISEHELWFERQGNDLLVTVIGEPTSVRVVDWYLVTDPDSRANHQLDFLLGGEWVSRDTDVEAIVEFQSNYPRPETPADLAALLDDPVYEATIATFYGINAPPVIGGIADQEILEGGAMELVLTLSDDYTPKAGIELIGAVLSGGELLSPGTGLVIGVVDADGRVTVALTPERHAAGVIDLSFTATDAGGVETTQHLRLTIDPVATTPLITQLSVTPGTSGAALAVSLAVEFPDDDGSEAHSIRIGGIPLGVTLNKGVFDGASGEWILAPADLSGLTLFAPDGWSTDLELAVRAYASEAGQTAVSLLHTAQVIINAPPTDIRSDLTVAENAANGSAIGRLNGIDPDGDVLSYTLLDSAGGRFSLDPDGMLRVADGALLDFEVAASHQITVKATDTSDKSVQRTLTIPVGNRNEGNMLPAALAFSLAENLPAGTVVGKVTASDWDAAGDPFASQRYGFLVGGNLLQVSNDELFAIDAQSGEITTRVPLDHETIATASYRVAARDNNGAAGYNQAETTVAITVGNSNEANSLPATLEFHVAENGGVGAEVGRVTAADPDTTSPFGEQRYYFNVDGDVSAISSDGRYAIDAISGVISARRALDRESADASTTHTVVARDNRGLGTFNAAESAVTIVVDNVNEAPTISSATSPAILSEPAGAGTAVATFAVLDPDATNPVVPHLVLTGADAALFAINGSTIVFAGGAPATFADAEAYANARGREAGDIDGDGRTDVLLGTIEVYASDGSENSGVLRRDVYIENVSEAPNAPGLVQSILHGETGNGLTPHANQVVARFSLSDPDGATPALVITSGNQNGWFQVAGDAIVFAPGVDLTADYLRANLGTKGIAPGFGGDLDADGLKELLVASLTVAARDSNGLWSETASLDVRIEDRNEAPEFGLSSYTYGIAETAPAYAHIGRAIATDLDDAAGALVYGFVGGSSRHDSQLGKTVGASADGKLLVDSATGAIYIAQNDAFDADGGASMFDYSLIVTDRNAGPHALSDTAALRIEVSGSNEPHTLRDAAGSIDEVSGLEPLTTIFDLRQLMLDDPEGRNMRWEFADGTTENGIWLLTSDGKLVLKNGGVDYEALVASGGMSGFSSTDDSSMNLSLQSLSLINESRIVDDPGGEIDPEDPGDGGAPGGGDPGDGSTNPPNVMTLAVRAIDDSIGVVAQGTFTATVKNVNEGAILTSSRQYYIVDDQDEDDVFGYLFAYDPDGAAGAIRFAIDYSSVVGVESSLSPGSSADVDNSGNPTVYLVNSNQLKFSVPNDGEWEGGIKNHPTLGGRWYYQYDYSFDVVMTDPTNLQSRERINVTFLKHGIHSAPPIVFDLDGDGIELISLSASAVYFDMDTDGFADRTGWVGADDGILALDRNGNGSIDGISEISFLEDVDGAQSDLEGLTAFDSNGNGRLDAGDERFFEFRIWRDLDQDGVSDEGELLSLPQAGITSLGLSSKPMEGGSRGPDNFILGTVSYERSNGSAGVAADVFLAFEGSAEIELAAPVLFDFDGDGETLVGLAASKTMFDQDGDGEKERTAWFDSGDAILAIDRNKNGVIDDISEISFISDLEGAKTDLEGLAAYDQNKDGKIDASDIDFAALKLWFDKDSDGITDAGELRSLSEAGIASISLTSTQDSTTGEQPDGSVIYGKATFTFDNGKTGTLLDTGLAYLANSATHATAIAGQAAVEPEFAFASMAFERKARKHMVYSLDGDLAVHLRKGGGELDARAGTVGAAASLTFAGKTYGYLDAIVLDLDGDGVDTKRAGKTGAAFDMNGDGSVDDTGWTSSRDGFLVIDRNGNGTIDDGSELSFLLDAPEARNALDGLAAFDSNGDGLVSRLDQRFGELKVWVDANHDGVSQAGELTTLADQGIVSISLRSVTTQDMQKLGRNVTLSTTVFTREDGSTHTAADVAFGFSPSRAPAQAAAARVGTIADWLGRFDERPLESTPLSLPAEGNDEAANGARRLALLLQDMAAFGTEGALHDHDKRHEAARMPLDYFA